MAKYTMCGGEDPRAPGCHRVVWKTDVNREGLCVLCGPADGDTRAAEAADKPRAAKGQAKNG